MKLGEKVRRPILADDLKAVAENGVGQVAAERLELGLGDFLDELVGNCGIVVIDHVALGAERCALHDHPGVTGDEELHLGRRGDAGRKLRSVVAKLDFLKRPGRGGDVGGENFFALAHRGCRHARLTGRHFDQLRT